MLEGRAGKYPCVNVEEYKAKSIGNQSGQHRRHVNVDKLSFRAPTASCASHHHSVSDEFSRRIVGGISRRPIRGFGRLVPSQACSLVLLDHLAQQRHAEQRRHVRRASTQSRARRTLLTLRRQRREEQLVCIACRKGKIGRPIRYYAACMLLALAEADDCMHPVLWLQKKCRKLLQKCMLTPTLPASAAAQRT
eukprot:1845152-Pleurochrysis_carterae.AAC.2